MNMLDVLHGDKKARNLVLGSIKRIWRMHPTRLKVQKSARVEEVTYRKDGSVSLRPAVFHICILCKAKAKDSKQDNYPQIHIDHIDPVVPIEVGLDNMTFDEYITRLFCNESNLQPLCTECHNKKTQEERAERKKYKVK